MENLFPKVLLMYLSHFRLVFHAPGYLQFRGFIAGLLILSTRKTVTRIAEFCFFVDSSLSSYHKFLSCSQWNLPRAIDSLIRLVINEVGDRLTFSDSYLLAVDTTYVTKPIGRMPGVQKWSEKDSTSTSITSQIGHQWAIGGLIGRFGNKVTCFPVITRLLSGLVRPLEFTVDSDGKAQPIGRISSIVAMIRQVALALPRSRWRVVADAFFSCAPFINPLIDAHITVITRLRKDAVGFDDPVYCGRGRRPIRGKKWKLAQLVSNFDSQLAEVMVYGKKVKRAYVTRTLWLRDVKAKVKVVALVTKANPVLLLSTDTTQSAAAIIEMYAARFSIETAIRDLKQSIGFGDYQLTNLLGLLRFSWLCCCALSIAHLILAKRRRHAWLWGNSHSSRQIHSTSLIALRRGLLRFVIRRILFSKSPGGMDLSKRDHRLDALLKVVA